MAGAFAHLLLHDAPERAPEAEQLASAVLDELSIAPPGSGAGADRDREAALALACAAAERAARRLGYLHDVTAALAAAKDTSAVAEVIVHRARRLVGAASATIRVLRGGALELLATCGDFELRPRSPSVPLVDGGPVAVAVRRGEAAWLEDRAAIERRFPGLVTGHDGEAALVTLPLTTGGRHLGALSFAFDHARRFDLEERACVLAVAGQCAHALDRALVHAGEHAAREAAQRAIYRLARLQAITAALSAASTVEGVASVLVHAARTALGAHSAVAYVRDPGGATLTLAAAIADPDAHRRPPGRLALDAPTPAAHAARTGEASWFETSAAAFAAFPGFGELFPGASRMGALAALPLRARGHLLGSVGLAFDEPRTFQPEDRGFLSSVADLGGQALDRARLLETEREARAEGDRAREGAERERALLDAILENAPIGIAFLDREQRFHRVNPKLAAINGLSLEAHLGKTPRDLFPGLPVDDLERRLRQVLETGTPLEDVEVVGETAGRRGRNVWLVSYYPVRTGREVVGVGVLVREVTKEREAEEFHRHVVGVVGHDLRNPLSAILTATKLLARGDVNQAQSRLLGHVVGSAGRIEEIVRTLLDFANVRAGRPVPIQRRACDLADVARAVADECILAYPGREVGCGGHGDCAGEWDAGRAAQLLANLVSNALQYSPASTPVQVRWTGGDHDVVLEVRNAGPPIDAEILPHVFEPFRRGEGRHPGGLGLGLFIARAIAVAHGGSLDVRSSAGDGTVFSVRLPR